MTIAPRRFHRRLPTMWTAAALNALAVRTTEPMLKSCCQFSIATWNRCRRRVEVGDDRLAPPVPVAVDDVAPVARPRAAPGRAAGRPATRPATGRRRPRLLRHAAGSTASRGRDSVGRPGRGVACTGVPASSSLQLARHRARALVAAAPALDPQHLFDATLACGSPSCDHLRRVRPAGRLLPAGRHAAVHRRLLFVATGELSHPLWLAPAAARRRGGRRQPRRLRDRPRRPGRRSSSGRLAAVQAGARRRRPHAFFDRYGAALDRAGALRADRAHVHHRRGRRRPDGLRGYARLQRHRRRRLGRRRSRCSGTCWATGSPPSRTTSS